MKSKDEALRLEKALIELIGKDEANEKMQQLSKYNSDFNEVELQKGNITRVIHLANKNTGILVIKL